MDNRLFDVYIMVDWSARSQPSPAKPSKDAIWIGEAEIDASAPIVPSQETYWRTRHASMDFLRKRLLYHTDQGRRVLVGFDFAFGYPSGTAEALELNQASEPWLALWTLLAEQIEDNPNNGNNRFEVAAALNARCGPGAPGPFWGCPHGFTHPTLLPTSPVYPYPVSSTLGLPRLRWIDATQSGVQPVWKLMGIGSVGGQTLLGIPAVYQLRFDPRLSSISQIWPFETGFATESISTSKPKVVYVELWPGVVPDSLDNSIPIRDQAQVRLVVQWLSKLDNQGTLGRYFTQPDTLPDHAVDAVVGEEAWILGTGIQIE